MCRSLYFIKMKTIAWIILLVCTTSTFAFSFEDGCPKARTIVQDLSIPSDRATVENVTSVYKNFTCVNVNMTKTTYSSVLMQFHVWDGNVTASIYNNFQTPYSKFGDHIGIVNVMDSHGSSQAQGFAAQNNVDDAPEVLMLFTPFNDTVPVPGACNMEANPAINANLFINYEVKNVLVNVSFSEANVGFKAHPPPCESSSPQHNRLRYDFYISYIPWNKYSRDSLFNELKKMMHVEDIQRHGQKIRTFGKNDRPELRLAMFNGRGIIVNIVVRDPQQGTASAYVPAVTYACGDNHGSLCHGRVQPGEAVLYGFGLVVGLALCFAGHRYFLAEVFFFGFLPFTLLSFMILAANTSLTHTVMLVLALVFGIPGGCLWLAVWWRFGYILPVMMWIAFTLGYLLSSIIFFTPFGNLSVWYNTVGYAMAFMCGVMIVPVIFIVFTKFLSMLACAVWGAYLFVAALSYYSGGILHYILLNIIHRASVGGYQEAFIIVPMEPVDYVLIVVWFLLIVAGVASQRRLTRGMRDFPMCPYKQWKSLRNQRTMVERQIHYNGNTPQTPRRRRIPGPTLDPTPDPTPETEPTTTDDQAPLIIN